MDRNSDPFRVGLSSRAAICSDYWRTMAGFKGVVPSGARCTTQAPPPARAGYAKLLERIQPQM